jgi:ornithine carbamoyltransferase
MNNLDIKGKDLLSLHDFAPDQINLIINNALEMKKNRQKFSKQLEGKTLAMLFEKRSLRTRASFEIGMTQLGGHAMFLKTDTIWGETHKDMGQVLGGYADVIMARMNTHESMVELAKYSNPPVVNGLTNMYHPCQILADLLTIKEKKNRLKGINLTYTWGYCQRARPAGVCNSLLFGSAKTGVNITIACPEGYEPDNEVYEKAKQDAKKTGAKVHITNDLKEGLQGADVVYTKNYAPAGLDKIKEEKLRQQNKHWIMTKKLFNLADPEAIFMHCMPVYRDQEVTSEVVDSPRSVIYDEANNRLHAQKAVLAQVTP